jgi:hypothetical protein
MRHARCAETRCSTWLCLALGAFFIAAVLLGARLARAAGIPPGQEALAADMLGRGATLAGGCRWDGASVRPGDIVKTVKDIKVLRQMALLLEEENKQLTAKVAELINEIALLKGEGEQGAKLRLQELERQLAVLQKRLYGESSEKRPAQPEQQASKQAGNGEKKPQRGHGLVSSPGCRFENRSTPWTRPTRPVPPVEARSSRGRVNSSNPKR